MTMTQTFETDPVARLAWQAAVALADAMNAAAEEHWCPECCETVRGQSCCGRCGVYFGEPCPACGAAGYHNPECPEIG